MEILKLGDDLFEKCMYYVVYSTPCLEKYYRSVAWTPVKLVHMSEILCYPYKGWGIKKAKPIQKSAIQIANFCFISNFVKILWSSSISMCIISL